MNLQHKRIIYSAQRGMLELSFLLAFAKTYVPTLNEASLDSFSLLMQDDDRHILEWMLQPETCPHDAFKEHLEAMKLHLQSGALRV